MTAAKKEKTEEKTENLDEINLSAEKKAKKKAKQAAWKEYKKSCEDIDGEFKEKKDEYYKTHNSKTKKTIMWAIGGVVVVATATVGAIAYLGTNADTENATETDDF